MGFENREAYSLVTLRGDLGTMDFGLLSGRLDEIAESGASHIVLELSGVGFMDASGLGTLANHWCRMRFKRGDLKIVGMSGRLWRLFRLMGMDAMFVPYRDVRQAAEKARPVLAAAN
jgi:anti-sigma B factor antagonist